MSCNHHHCDHNHEVKVQQITLEDGRSAEKHISVDANGNEVVEIFVEEKRPKKLEKRIVRERKTIVAKETHEDVHDGEVTQVKVLSLEPEVPLQVREKIQVVDHAKIVDGEYATKDDVVAAIAELMNHGHVPVTASAVEDVQPVSAMQTVEHNVQEGAHKKNNTLVVAMGVLLLGQMAFLGYMMFFM